jgi:predicted nucleic acid-binding protein
MMFVVDTNVLVYAADQDSCFHRPCLALLERSCSQSSAWFVTWPILYSRIRMK